jgi:DNA-binding MarR family transcriptional regulator
MSDATSPGELLLMGASRLNRLQIERLGELRVPLTLRQYRILQRIDEGHTSVSDLSRLAHRSVPTVSESVDGLLKRGLLVRADSPADRRAVVLSLTPAGTRARKAAERCLADLAASVFDSLSASKQKVLGELARKMYDVSGSAMWGPDA